MLANFLCCYCSDDGDDDGDDTEDDDENEEDADENEDDANHHLSTMNDDCYHH